VVRNQKAARGGEIQNLFDGGFFNYLKRERNEDESKAGSFTNQNAVGL
jgi:hypothetical protein